MSGTPQGVTAAAAPLAGSDFDGGLGAEQTPAQIETVADLRLIGQALTRRGYSAADVDAIMSNNWLRVLRQLVS